MMARTSVYPPVVRRRRRWWRILRNLLLLLALAAAAYGTWPFMDVGDRINWCGQVYRVAVTDLTWAEVNNGASSAVQPLFNYPPRLPRREVYGIPPTTPTACPTQLFIHTGTDRYTKYLPAGS
jgi:hypothetical protein